MSQKYVLCFWTPTKTVMDEVVDKNELKQGMVNILQFVTDKGAITTKNIIAHF